MRKVLLLFLSLLLLLFPLAGFSLAAEAARVEIPVVIEGGGTATMNSEVNCPLPVEPTIQVDNGRTGRFYIDFTASGVFHYTIKAQFSENGTTRDADEAYRVTVEVYQRQNGSLYSVTTVNSSINPDKKDLVRFDKTPPTTTNPGTPETTTEPGTPESTTTPGTPGTPKKPGPPESTTSPGTPGSPKKPGTPESTTTPQTTQKRTSTPRTGDETHLLRYVLLAMASSFGLFLLAMLYTVNTNKLIREDEYFD